MTATTRLIILKLIPALILIATAAFLIQPVFAKELSASRQDATSTSTTRKDKVEERIETRKENIKERKENKKANVEERTTTIKERPVSGEAKLKERLQKFRDKKKAEVAERINTNLNEINQKRTEQILKHLDKMSSILDRLEARVKEKAPDIKDATAARAAIASARSTIATAKAEVKMQAEKDYTIQVSSESRIKTDVKKMRDQLHTDLTAVRELVINAKQAVGSAIRVAKSGPAPDGAEPKEGTPSGKQ